MSDFVRIQTGNVVSRGVFQREFGQARNLPVKVPRTVRMSESRVPAGEWLLAQPVRRDGLCMRDRVLSARECTKLVPTLLDRVSTLRAESPLYA